jgi:hypothetical protein
MTLSPGTLTAVTFNQLETASGYDAAVLQDGQYIQEILTNTNNEGGGVDPAGCRGVPWFSRNLLCNGGFSISQRGPGPWNATTVNQCPSDGWRVQGGTWSRETATTDSSVYSLKCVQDGTNAATLWQTIYEIDAFKGERVSFSGRVFTPGSFAGHVEMWDTTAGGDESNVVTSAVVGASAGWTTVNAVLTVRSTAVTISVSYVADDSTGTLYFDNFMATRTDGPVAFQPTNPALDLLNCQRRYFTTHFSYSIRTTSGGSHNQESWEIVFPLPMVALPTASITASGVPADTNNSVALVLSSITTTEIGQVLFDTGGTGPYYSLNMVVVVDAGVF